MKKIDYSISAAMSLYAISISAAEDEADANENIEQAEEGTDVLEMDDEEFLKAMESDLSKLPEKDDNGGSDDNVNESDTADDDDVDNNDDTSNVEGDDQEEPPAAEADQPDEESAQQDGGSNDQPEETSADETKQQIDYEAEFKRLFSPIKASGREIRMKNVDQIINRIQLAEDYNKKMQAMRPYTKTLKTLEKAGILGDEETINFLLEVKNKKPEAIKKLIAEADIDPMDLVGDDDLEQAREYRPQNHMVSDTEVAIEEALTSISHSPAYGDTVRTISEVFDPKSREIISEHPEYIRSLNDDIENGIYDQVMQEVQYQKEMGYIPPQISDIEAYIGTVQYLAQQEMAAQQQQMQQQNPQQQKNQPTQQQQRQQRTSDPKRRKAMQSPGGGSKRGKKQYDPMEVLEMSDEEFMKEFGAGLT